MLYDEKISFIEDTQTKVRACSIENYRPHWHEGCIELVFVLKGSLNLIASYDRFTLHEGDCMAINVGDIHYLYSDRDNLVFSIYIDLSAFQEKYPYIYDLDFICESFNANSIQAVHVNELKKMMVKAIVEAAKEEKDKDKINECIEGMVGLFVNRFDMIHYYNGKDVPDEQLERYHRIMGIIQEECAGKISIEEIAGREYMGRTYMSQFWKKMTNMNFTEYINSRRCELAERMLLTTKKSINEISVACGFSDTKYIYRSFKKWYDDTPSGYRDSMLEYADKKENYVEYDSSSILSKFGKTLLDSMLDDDNIYLLHSAGLDDDWKGRFAGQIKKYTGSRVKKEMIRESHKASKLDELYVPLADSSVIALENGHVSIDEGIVDDVFRVVNDLDYILCVEVNYEDRPAQEWLKVISALVAYVKKTEPEMLKKCRFYIYFSGFERNLEVKALEKKLRSVVEPESIKIAMRFN